MEIHFHREGPPLRRDNAGAIRVGSSRVLLELVIRAFQDGATAEGIAQRYPSATLSDIYSVIAYYLRHRGEIDAYLQEREQLAESVRQRVSSLQGEIRDGLLARQRADGETDGSADLGVDEALALNRELRSASASRFSV